MPRIVSATLTVGFRDTSEQQGGIMLLEIDDRPDGLNGGNTQFQPGDVVYFLRYIGSLVTLITQKSNVGTISGAGSGTRQITDLVTLNATRETTLRYPVASGFSASWVGQRYDANGAPKTISYSLVGDVVQFSEPVYGALEVTYTTAFSAFKLSNVPLDITQAFIFALGQIPDPEDA